MERDEIYETIMQAEPEDIKEMANVMREWYSPDVTRGAESALLMLRVEESVEHLVFNAGEILVTTAEVRISDSLGYAMILGPDKEKALDAAVLMAAVEAELPGGKEVEELALRLRATAEGRVREEQEVANSTRVRFELMGGQDPSVVGQAQKGGEDE